MGQTFSAIDGKIRKWIEGQHVYFVATAPLAEDGFINLSPKGFDSLRILDEHTLAYLDVGGSGIETMAHLKENGRIVIMMCAFAGPPKIYRFHGTGEVVTANDPEFAKLVAKFDRTALGVRAIVRVAVERISDSCGYGVPLTDYTGERKSMDNFLRGKSTDDMREYFKEKNSTSIDGLPGITEAEADAYELPKGRREN